MYYSVPSRDGNSVVETFVLFYLVDGDPKWGRHLYLDVYCKRLRDPTETKFPLARLASHSSLSLVRKGVHKRIPACSPVRDPVSRTNGS